MPRGTVRFVVLVCVVLVGMASLTSAAGAKSKGGWSLKFTGGIAGTAKSIKVINCSEPAAGGGNQLSPTANFKVGKASYQIHLRFDPPVQAGTRPFGHSSTSATVGVTIVENGSTPGNWESGDGNGTATVKSNLKSGTLDGQLIGTGANGIATTVKGKFSCPSFTP